MIQDAFKNDFMNFNGGLIGLRIKNENLMVQDMSGREKTMKTRKILKLARVQEAWLPDSLINAFTL